MSETKLVLEIDKPHYTVRLYGNMLQIDLKGTVKSDIEEALENKPILRETIGGILSIFVPLHIPLSHVDSVHMNNKGEVRIKMPLHRNITIPLEVNEAKRLADKLNDLVPKEKKKELERIIKEHKLKKIEEAEHELAKERVIIPIAQFPIPEPPGVLEEEKEAEKRRIEEAEKQG